MRFNLPQVLLVLLATAPAPCDAAFTPQQSVAQWIVSKKVAVKTIASYSPGGIEKEVIVEKKIVEPTTEQVAIDKPFVNDGPFSWMSQYLNKFGILQEGKMLQMDRFPFVVDIDESSKPSAEESSNLRREAAENLTNIGMDERKRRDNAGTFMLGAAATYAFWAAAIADDGGIMGHLIRFAVVGPLALGWGYKLSAQKGLWNIAQAGVWDVDGTGMSKIEDPNLASAILNKVNDLNVETGAKATAIAAAFAALPQSTSSPLAGVAAIFAALYALNGKLPTSKP